jgi:hypothetical protein
LEFVNILNCVSGLFLLFLQSQPGGPDGPIVVNIAEPAKNELSGLRDVLLGSLGLSGLLGLAAILLGIAVGGLMFWIKKRATE